MQEACSKSIGTEAMRIRAAYERRRPEGRYSWFNRGHLFMLQDQERHLLALLASCGCTRLQSSRILEIGCGTGHWLREFIKWGARPENVVGVDLLAERIAEARSLCPNSVCLQCGNAAQLEFPDATFDVVFQSTVFTSVLDADMRARIASEMQRVLKADGLILWYDYHVDNPWNPDVRGVRKHEISELFPRCVIHLRRVTLAPPLVRMLAPRSWLLCYLLGKVPLLCTHYLGVIRKG